MEQLNCDSVTNVRILRGQFLIGAQPNKLGIANFPIYIYLRFALTALNRFIVNAASHKSKPNIINSLNSYRLEKNRNRYIARRRKTFLEMYGRFDFPSVIGIIWNCIFGERERQCVVWQRLPLKSESYSIPTGFDRIITTRINLVYSSRKCSAGRWRRGRGNPMKSAWTCDWCLAARINCLKLRFICCLWFSSPQAKKYAKYVCAAVLEC